MFDGLSNTMMISEQNDILTADNGTRLPIGSGIAYGFLIGTWLDTTPNIYSQPPQNNFDARTHQCTTLRHRINEKEGWPYAFEFGEHSAQTNLFGVGVMGVNIPLNSAHPGGVNAVFGDGSIRFLRDTTEIRPLAALATRDDGVVINGD